MHLCSCSDRPKLGVLQYMLLLVVCWVGLHTMPLFRERQGRATDKTPYWRPIRQTKRPHDAPSSTLNIRNTSQVAPKLCSHVYCLYQDCVSTQSWCKQYILLIPEFCPGGQRQGLTLNTSTLLVWNDSKKASKPIESPRSEPRPCIRQKSLSVAAWFAFLGTEQAAHARSWDFLLSSRQKCRKEEELMLISRLYGHM